MNKYAVIGNPIKHSKSPEIHGAFAKQEQVALEYHRILSEQTNFTDTVNSFFAEGGSGLNVTVPFKLIAYEQCVHVDEYAKAAQAVNTISLNEHRQWIGANTDGIGLLTDLKNNLRLSIKNKSILVLGAGGATRGILLPLLNEQPKKIIIANRTIDKAIHLANSFEYLGPAIHGCGFADVSHSAFDIVINATSASLNNTVPPIASHLVNENTVCYDLAYSDEPTVFIDWATQQGVKSVHDGIGMLIEQAAESYYIWRDFKPNTKEIFTLLRPQV